jgi:hypothetical protein
MGMYSQDASPGLLFAFSTGRVSKGRGEEQGAQYDESNGTQSQIPFRYDTPDLVAPVDYQASLCLYSEIEFEAITLASPATLLIGYSIDEGVNIVNIGSQVLTSGTGPLGRVGSAKYRINFMLTARKVRFVFQDSSTNGQIFIPWIRVYRKVGGLS